jgi:hypothetical protein
MNSQFKSLEQGLELLSERKNYADSLKKNIKKCGNVGVIEGFTGMEGFTGKAQPHVVGKVYKKGDMVIASGEGGGMIYKALKDSPVYRHDWVKVGDAEYEAYIVSDTAATATAAAATATAAAATATAAAAATAAATATATETTATTAAAATAAAATATESATVVRNAMDIAKIAQLRADYKTVETNFNEYNDSYKTKYEDFLQDYSGVTHAVEKCQLECMEWDAYTIGTADMSNMAARINKTKQKEACKAGCQFNSPKILNCEDKFEGTTVVKGPLNQKCIDSRTGDGEDETTLRSSYDTNGVSAWDGLCKCKLGDKFSPYYITGDNKYVHCSDFGTGSIEHTACENGKGTLYKEPALNSNDTFATKYTNITKKNKDIETASKKLLQIINDLNVMGETIILNKKLNLDDFRKNTSKFDNIKKNIKKLSNKRKTDTLDKQVYDTLLLKKSTDLRLYVWAILAIGFGLTALIKIRNL